MYYIIIYIIYTYFGNGKNFRDWMPTFNKSMKLLCV